MFSANGAQVFMMKTLIVQIDPSQGWTTNHAERGTASGPKKIPSK